MNPKFKRLGQTLFIGAYVFVASGFLNAAAHEPHPNCTLPKTPNTTALVLYKEPKLLRDIPCADPNYRGFLIFLAMGDRKNEQGLSSRTGIFTNPDNLIFARTMLLCYMLDKNFLRPFEESPDRGSFSESKGSDTQAEPSSAVQQDEKSSEEEVVEKMSPKPLHNMSSFQGLRNLRTCSANSSELTDLVIRYFTEDGDGELSYNACGSRLPIKKLGRKSARFFGKAHDTFKRASEAAELSSLEILSAVVTVIEKALDWWIASDDADKADAQLNQLIAELDAVFDAVPEKKLSKRQAHYMEKAREVVIRKIGGINDETNRAKGQKTFVGVKVANDLVRVGTDLKLFSFLGQEGAGFVYKVVSTVLVERFSMKAFGTCGPLVQEILNQLKSDEQRTLVHTEVDQILMESVAHNGPSIASESLQCALILAKLGALIYAQMSTPLFFNVLARNVEALAYVELTNIGSNIVLDLIPAQSYETEIAILVAALAETYELEKAPSGYLLTPKIDLAVKLMRTLPGGAPQELSTLSEIRHALAKKLILLEPRLFAFIILDRLAQDEELGKRTTETFLLGLKVPAEEIQDWTILATFFGPHFSFANELVLKTLRLQK